MALQGTLKDFALPDIFQLIGIQRKTGLLTLESGQETVSLKFVEGQIVGAETSSVSTEDRLGELLVRTGRISQAQLDEALRLQKQTLRRLGHILVDLGGIGEEELVEALRVQSSQVVYRLFRWREGTYRFAAAESVDYDQSHCAPISSETVLMEGARMMDEWPIIERRIRSERMIVRLTDAGRAVDLDDVADAEDDDLDFDLGFDADRPERPEGEEETKKKKEEKSSGPAPLSAEEREVLMFVDGRRTVGTIRDGSAMGEFDVYRILADLMNRGLVEEAGIERAQQSRSVLLLTRLSDWTAQIAVAGLSLAALATLPANPWTPWRALQADQTSDRLRVYVSIARLEQLERAIKVFQLDAGTPPGDLETLVHGGYVRPEDMLDPWGRPFGFDVSSAGYRLQALDATGRPAPELTISRRFTAVQQMLVPDSGPDPAP